MNFQRPRLAAIALLACAAAAAASWSALAQSAPPADAALFAGDELRLPADYRQWIYLSTGFDMSYSAASRSGHHMFDNVFVDPASWRVFQKTGTWPEGTTLVLEGRGASDQGSINRAGHFQDTETMGVEVHVKDSARFAGGWAFFSFDGDAPAKKIPSDAACYACHAAHAAVDTTFVQFYPTLLPLAQARGTLSAAYRAENPGH